MLLARGDDAAIQLLIIPVFIVIAVLSIVWTRSRSTSIIEQWASENCFELLAYEQRFLRTGPFFFRHGKGHTVYHVTVRDAEGNVRSGYARCGGWIGGLLSDKIVVEWDA